MSLASRRSNAPTQISFAAYLQGTYGNMSDGSLESDNSIEAMPAQLPPPTYETTLRIDNNADVLTTAVELDSDEEGGDDDDDGTDFGYIVRPDRLTPRAMPITITKADSPATTPMPTHRRRSSCSKSPVAPRSPKRVFDMFKRPSVQLSTRTKSPVRRPASQSVATQCEPDPTHAQYLMTRRPSLPSSGFATNLPSSVSWVQTVDRATYVEKLDRVNALLERGELHAARKAVREAFDGRCELVKFEKLGSREASPVRLYIDTAASTADVASLCSDDDGEEDEFDDISELGSNADYDSFGRQRHVERGRKRSTITYVPDDDDEDDVDTNGGVAAELGSAAEQASNSIAGSISAKLKKFRFGRSPSRSSDQQVYASSVTRIDSTLDPASAASIAQATADRRWSTASSFGARSIRSVQSRDNIGGRGTTTSRRSSLANFSIPPSTAGTSISRASNASFLTVPPTPPLPQQQQIRNAPREAWCLLFHPA